MTDAELNKVYVDAVKFDATMTPLQLNQARRFIDGVFKLLQPAGFIDETNAVAWDSFELTGEQVEPLFKKPSCLE